MLLKCFKSSQVDVMLAHEKIIMKLVSFMLPIALIEGLSISLSPYSRAPSRIES